MAKATWPRCVFFLAWYAAALLCREISALVILYLRRTLFLEALAMLETLFPFDFLSCAIFRSASSDEAFAVRKTVSSSACTGPDARNSTPAATDPCRNASAFKATE
eukprot:937714-Pyramimonas_sp.AAC.1